MTQEEKSLLLHDLCARFLYGVFLKIGEYSDYTLQGIVHSNVNKPLLVRCNGSDFECSIEVVRPYLRPMSSMTEEEKEELSHLLPKDWSIEIDKLNNFYFDMSPSIFMEIDVFLNIIDWLNKYHFDYRGLIEKGLALEAPKDMYKIIDK